MEICNLKDALRSTVKDYDRKLAELSYECNRRINSMNAEYVKLAALLPGVLAQNSGSNDGVLLQGNPGVFFSNGNSVASMMLPAVSAATQMANPAAPASFHQAPKQAILPTPASSKGSVPVTDMLHSLSQAAVSLHEENERVKLTQSPSSNGKRQATDDGGSGNAKAASRATV
jgi:hypothetical protein